MWFPTFRRWFNVASTTTGKTSIKAGNRFKTLVSLLRKPWRISRLCQSDNNLRSEIELLQVLQSALVNRLPLPETLDNFARDYRAIKQTQIRSFARTLSRGHSLASSVEQHPSLFSGESQLAIRLAEVADSSAILTETIACKSAQLSRSLGTIQFRYRHWAMMTAFFTFFVSFQIFFIVPSLKQIASEFSFQQVPFLAQIQIILDRLTAAWPVVFLLAGIAFLFFLSARLRSRAFSILQSFNVLSTKPASQSNVYKLLSLITRHKNSTLLSLLATLGKYFPDKLERQKFLILRNDIELGANPWTAMRETGLITRTDEAFLLSNEGNDPRNIEAQSYFLDSRAESTQLEQQASQDRRAILFDTGMTLLFGGITLVIASYVFANVYSILLGDFAHD